MAKKVPYYFVFALLLFNCGRQDILQIPETTETSRLFNYDWNFIRDIDEHLSGDFFRLNGETVDGWETVQLPHSAYIEPLVITDQQWTGTAVYRKTFHVEEELRGRHVSIRFDAAMHETEIYLNGEHIYSNYGGYLPFVVNLTGRLNYGNDNVLLLTLNNEDNPDIPPGKPLAELDFNYFNGIYRNVTKVVKDLLHISDPILADRPAAGGLYVWFDEISTRHSIVNVQADIQNDDQIARFASVRYVLQNRDGETVASSQTDVRKVESGTNELFTVALNVKQPKLWSPDHPYLYDLTVQLYEGNELVDSEQQRIGIRTFTIDGENGFVLNGERIQIRGTNRHQEYPYIGYALSDNAQYRDVWKIKKAGFNFIRTGHYPPASSFLDAFDELGILFMNAIPGWQFFGGDRFQKNAYQDIRKMIRRDRNHPSIIIWEASLNETGMSKEFMDNAVRIVREELPFGDVYTSGWIDYAYDIFIPARQHSSPPDYWSGYDVDKPLFIAEYGDWEYYAHNAGFNQDAFEDLQEEERTSRQLRINGQTRLAQQALNFQEAHNSNLYSPAFGDANWVMYDYNRGYADDLCACGISDIFRIPKFAYYFFQSQSGPDLSTNAVFHRPMVYIANYWSDPDFTDVKVFSNTEEVALYLNDELIERRLPDRDRVSTNLKHPPFTFKMDEYLPGTLRAVGYINGEPAAEIKRQTPGQPSAIHLSADFSNRDLEAGVNDIIFIYAYIVDDNGIKVPINEKIVTFEIDGDADLIGHNPKSVEAGIASILLQARKYPGELTIHASAPGIIPDRLIINTQHK